LRSNAVKARRLTLVLALTSFSFISACSSLGPTEDTAPRTAPPASSLPGDAVPLKEPRSRYGNGPYYEVFGETYKVLDSSYGYQERGVASWYGVPYHGRTTASGETFDMNDLTAAHPSLPFGSRVRVTNLGNGRSLVLEINDRGPFVKQRIIDVSKRAAKELGFLRDGIARVRVEVL